MTKKLSKKEADETLARHQRKCAVCHHPDRETIEADFLEWWDILDIVEEFGLKDTRTVSRHARATGLLELRRQNLRTMLDCILEAPLTSVSADSVIRAIRAYSCLDQFGRWTDPPSHVVFTAERPAPQPALQSLGETGSLDEEAHELLGPAPGRASEATPPDGEGVPDSSATDPALIAVSRLDIPLSN